MYVHCECIYHLYYTVNLITKLNNFRLRIEKKMKTFYKLGLKLPIYLMVKTECL